MKLQEKIKKDLVIAIKDRDGVRKDTLRVILGELGRQEKKELTDDDVIRVLKKLLKSERELLEKSGAVNDTEFIRIIDTYLPKMASDEEILLWIRENVDFAAYKNKMQAMGVIMAHFGAAADGSRVKRLLVKI
jgi:uncharacterized protein